MDGNYLIYESSYNSGNNIVHFFKISPSGDSVWTRAFIYPGLSYPRLIETNDSGFVMLAGRNNYSVLVKYDKNGDSLWTREFTYQTPFGNSSYSISLLETNDHGFFVVNAHDDSDIVYYDLQFLRLDSIGNQLWVRDYNFGHDALGLGYIIQSTDTNFLVQFRIAEGGPNIPYGVLLSVDTAGNYFVVDYTNEPGYFGGDLISKGNDSNFIIVGNARDNWDDFGYGTLKKITPSGTALWFNVFNQSSRMKSVSSTSDNGCIVACDSFVNPDVSEFQLKRFDAGGNLLWSKTFPIDHHESACSVKQTSDGGFIAVGYHESFFHYETYIVRTDSSGNLLNNGFTISSDNLSPCQGDTVTLSTQNANSYLWSDGRTSQSISVTRNGNYNVRVSDSAGIVSYTSFYNVSFKPKPPLDLGDDTLICFADVLTLDAGSGFTDYLWHDGSTSQAISVSGTMQDLVTCYVRISDSSGCSNTDTIQVVIDVCNGVNAIETGGDFTLGPNPFHDLLYFCSAGNSSSYYLISVFNNMGRTVFEKQISRIEEVDLTGLPPGFYSIRLKSKTGIFSGKFVKY